MRLTTEDHSAVIAYLDAAKKSRPSLDIAGHFGVSDRTLRRWKNGEVTPPAHVVAELQRLLDFGGSTPNNAGGLLGPIYLAVAIGMNLWFVASALRLLHERTPEAARRVFRVSLAYLFSLFVAMNVDLLARL